MYYSKWVSVQNWNEWIGESVACLAFMQVYASVWEMLSNKIPTCKQMPQDIFSLAQLSFANMYLVCSWLFWHHLRLMVETEISLVQQKAVRIFVYILHIKHSKWRRQGRLFFFFLLSSFHQNTLIWIELTVGPLPVPSSMCALFIKIIIIIQKKIWILKNIFIIWKWTKTVQ